MQPNKSGPTCMCRMTQSGQLAKKNPYNKKNITRWLEDMTNFFMFSWQEQYLTRLLCSLVRYCSCHSNIKFISSRNRVISSIYLILCFSFILLWKRVISHTVHSKTVFLTTLLILCTHSRVEPHGTCQCSSMQGSH